MPRAACCRRSTPKGVTSPLLRYDPYGGLRPGSSATPGIGYSGEWSDPTGLVNLRFRAYDPALGRFISRDTFGGLLTAPQSANRHAYALGNPLRYTDPSGHFVSPQAPPVPAPVFEPMGFVPTAEAYVPPSQPQSPLDWGLGFLQGMGDSVSSAFDGAVDTVVGGANCVINVDCAVGHAQGAVSTVANGVGDFVADPRRTVSDGWNAAWSGAGSFLIQAGASAADLQDRMWSGDGRTAGRAAGDIAVTVAVAGAPVKVPAIVRAAQPRFPPIKPGSAGGVTAGQRFPPNIRRQALEENPGTCVYCRMHADDPWIDHAIPRARGGNATIDNAQVTCRWCDQSKGARGYPVNPPGGYEGPWPPRHWGQR